MARRRLTPPASPDVPRAEHFEAPAEERAVARLAPIARVASDAAEAAAFDEVSETLRRARESGRLVLDLPLEAIAPDHLTRDRLPVEDEETAALRESIRLHGQRAPIEVTPLAGALPYGLISGWRRLAALKALHAETGEARFATVQALVRRPEAAADAYVAMVEENEIRVGLSPYERARVAALATDRGVFESEKKALLALFATASRAKRSRIRAFLRIHRALDGVLRFPAHLPERLGLRLAARLGAGRVGDGTPEEDDGRDFDRTAAQAIAEAIARDDPRTPEAEMRTLEAALADEKASAPAKAGAQDAASARTSGGPRGESLRPGVTLRQALRGRTLTLRLTGEGVTPDLAREIRALLETLPSR